MDIRRNLSDENYVSKWSARRVNECSSDSVVTKCSFRNCNEQHNLKKTKFKKESIIKHYINDSTDEQLMLCNAHYQEVYKHFKVSSTPCAGCGNCPRRGTAYTRHCPNPLVINDHMQNQLGIECHITPSDRICYVCYKLHNQMLHNIQAGNIPSDTALSDLISSLNYIKGDGLENAIAKTAMYVGQHLLSQKALLLPQVSIIFLQEYGIPVSDASSLEIETGEYTVKYSSRWLLSQMNNSPRSTCTIQMCA